MDTAMSHTIAATNTINGFTSRRLTNLTTFAPSNFLSLFNNRKIPKTHLLTSCSTKPNDGKTSEKNENLISQNKAQPTLNPAYSSGLVFGLGSENSWDGLEIGSPVVKRYISDEEERWYMWYHGRSNTNPEVDTIGLALSSNGIHWKRGEGAAISRSDVGLVMNSSENWWCFDTQSIKPCEVVVMSNSKVIANNGVYWLYYTGFNSEKIEYPDYPLGEIYKCLPGLAMSQDGRHWARIEGEHHSGALFDVGLDNEWDSLFIASPQVYFHGSGDLRMYYHSFDVEKGHFCIGIARSKDGMKWLKLGKVLGGGIKGGFDENGVMNPRVMRNRKDGMYLMTYEGVDLDGKRRIGMAYSLDGLKNWKRRDQDSPVFKESVDGWDNEGVGSPCLVQIDGGDEDEWRLYYKGIGKGGKTGIGMAVSKGNELTSFQRASAFQF